MMRPSSVRLRNVLFLLIVSFVCTFRYSLSDSQNAADQQQETAAFEASASGDTVELDSDMTEKLHRELKETLEDDLNKMVESKMRETGSSFEDVKKQAKESLGDINWEDFWGKEAEILEKAIAGVKIDSQDFLCDCNLIWFTSIINKINPASLENNKCHYPPNLRGQKLSELAAKDLTCDKNPKPILIRGPMDANVEISEDVKFTCVVKTTEISSVEFEWIYQESAKNSMGDTRLTPEKGVIEINTPDVSKIVGNVVESSLTMKRLERTRGAFPEGFIKCQVRNRYGSTVSNLAELSLFQFAHFLSTPRNQTVEVGDNVKLNCNAIGYPEPLVSWEFPREPDEYKGRTQMSSDGRTVTIERIQENDSGKYTCTAANTASKIAIDIYVRLAPSRELIEFNNDVEYSLGKDAVLKCHHPEIFPAVSTEWYFNNSLLHSNSRYQFVDDGSILVISQVESDDQGYYQCKVFNELGQAVATTKLHVSEAGLFKTAPLWLWIASVAVLAMLLTSLIWLGVFFVTKSQRGQSDFGTESTNLPMPLERHLEDQQKSAKRLADNRAQGVVSWGSEYHQTPTPVMQTPSSQNSDICNSSYHQLQHPQPIPQHSPFYIPTPSLGPYEPPLGMSPGPRWAPRAATMPDLDIDYQNSPIHQQQLMPPPALPTPTFSYNPSLTRSINQISLGQSDQTSAPGPDRNRHRNRSGARKSTDSRSMRDLPRRSEHRP